jgi:hypothetical protein
MRAVEPSPEVLSNGNLRWFRQRASISSGEQTRELALGVLAPALNGRISGLAPAGGVAANIEFEAPAVLAAAGDVASAHGLGSIDAIDTTLPHITLATSSWEGVRGEELIKSRTLAATSVHAASLIDGWVDKWVSLGDVSVV